ncbi:MAG TPA: DNA-3-methyladenine glycosylase [Anaerolineae bacterium]|nr:DNA-3-methyladenine glycosylase [Anaerolineae bacterium]
MFGGGVVGERLERPFFARPARQVAPALLGQYLVREWGSGPYAGKRVVGRIVETEAYCDSDEGPDLACHGSKNGGRPTARTEVMFGRAGVAYVYFTYGVHWMFNVVTGEEGEANAVLVRAVEPVAGEGVIKLLRPGVKRKAWTNGPAKLAKGMGIGGAFNGVDLCGGGGALWLEVGDGVGEVAVGPRVGLGKTPEPWFSRPWRYWEKGNGWVSKYR